MRARRQLTTTTTATATASCPKGLVEGGVAEDFMRKDIKGGGSMGDGNNAPYTWKYTCPDGEKPYHNKTITGDYEEVLDQWQVECTQQQISFQCCTKNCTCHDPVDSTSTAASTNDIASKTSTAMAGGAKVRFQ